jgi:hypothetical protein
MNVTVTFDLFAQILGEKETFRVCFICDVRKKKGKVEVKRNKGRLSCYLYLLLATNPAQKPVFPTNFPTQGRVVVGL